MDKSFDSELDSFYVGNHDSSELKQFIHRNDVYKKLEFDIKENTAINLVYEFLKDGHLDSEMQILIRQHHNYYWFLFSTVSNIYYFNARETHI